MNRYACHALGEKYCARIDRFERPLFVFAHHDDEICMSGLLQRACTDRHIIWVTNSDGLYYESDLTPEEYGKIRIREGVCAAATVGVTENATHCLGWSEVEIYRRLSELYSGESTVWQVMPFFKKISSQILEAIFQIKPDVVFVLAWQGGNPEHDLTNFFTHLAIQEFNKKGRPIELIQAPAYEYALLIAQRFHPLYTGARMRIQLTPKEQEKKSDLIKAYPSQTRLFNSFRKVFRFLGKLESFTGGPGTLEEFISIEEFGPVPLGLDYSRNTHILDSCTYMFDDFEGVPVTFDKSIKPIIQSFLVS